jgi:hypothetical protein
VVLKVDGAGHSSILAGPRIEGFSGDGGPAAKAELAAPLVDGSAAYFSDTDNQRVRGVPGPGSFRIGVSFSALLVIVAVAVLGGSVFLTRKRRRRAPAIS